MGFLRAGSAGVAAAALLGLLLVAVGVDWDLAEGMRPGFRHLHGSLTEAGIAHVYARS